MNYKLSQKGYTTIEANVGMDYGRALMVQAGYKGSGINDVIWMGDVINSACHLCNEDRGISGKRILLGEVVYNNLNEHNQGLCEIYDEDRSVYGSNAINKSMNEWLKEQKYK